MSAGLIAQLMAAVTCAVFCDEAQGQEATSQTPAAIVWESSIVEGVSPKAQVSPNAQETEPPKPSTMERTSKSESTGGVKAGPRFESQVEPSSFPTGDSNETDEVISPEAFRQARAAKAAGIGSRGRTEQIPTRDLAADNAMPLIAPSSLERPVKERGPALLPVEIYPSRITPANSNAAAISKPQTRDSIVELSPPAPSEPSLQRADWNDFPTDLPNDETTEPSKPTSPFRFASTRKMAQDLPSLPSLPGKQTKGSKTNAGAAKSAAKKKQKAPGVLASADSFVLAAQPELGAHYKLENPVVDQRAWKSETYMSDFSPDAIDPHMPVDPWAEMQIYEGKTLNANQRPLIELGRPWYQLGQLNPGSSLLGFHNNITPQFLVYGDFRTAIASNQLGGNSTTLSASELNLDFDLKLTGTERFHLFMSPLDDGVTNTGYRFDDDEFVNEFDAQIDFGYFEGDLGAIVGGFVGKTLPFDFPFAIGEIPLLFQNGIWMEDAILGFAATIPARNSPRFDISNMDITFFAGFDQLNSDAFPGDNSAAKIYGIASFIEANNGYWEIDYAFLEDRTTDDRSYHNIGIAFTRRFGRLLSNSTRIIVNAGQSTDVVENTADGVLLLSENSLITGAPSTVVPYLNFFAGFDRPQSAARAAAAGGVLRNTGLLFESDGMTGFPTLDATANDTFGMSLGLNLIASDFGQQLVVETSMLGVMGDDPNRNAQGDQYGVGFRYQLPLTNAIIFRSDAMYGFRRNDEDIHGFRMELRHKF